MLELKKIRDVTVFFCFYAQIVDSMKMDEKGIVDLTCEI